MAISTSRLSAQARSSVSTLPGLRDGVELDHAGGGQVGEVAGIGVVDADAEREHLARGPDRLGRCASALGVDAGEGLLDVAHRAELTMSA
jgi:hypothetical protein